jgi:hypothetical protein
VIRINAPDRAKAIRAYVNVYRNMDDGRTGSAWYYERSGRDWLYEFEDSAGGVYLFESAQGFRAFMESDGWDVP